MPAFRGHSIRELVRRSLSTTGNFLKAAEFLSGKPQALQLRYLTTLQTIASERSNIVVFPLPLELTRVFARPDTEAPGAAD